MTLHQKKENNMRHCNGETVQVRESEGTNLAVLLEEAAETVKSLSGWHNLDVSLNISEHEKAYYRVTLYSHV